MTKQEYIAQLGEFLTDRGMTMSIPELADHLNRNKFSTNYGTEFKGERGTFTLVDAVFDDLVKQNKKMNADKVAKGFPKKDGTYAFEKKKIK